MNEVAAIMEHLIGLLMIDERVSGQNVRTLLKEIFGDKHSIEIAKNKQISRPVPVSSKVPLGATLLRDCGRKWTIRA
jgi:hypothetical protein